MTKQVTMPDGHVIYNVPEDVKDEDVINKYLDRKLKKEEIDLLEKTDDEAVSEETTEPSYAADMARAVTKYGSTVPNIIADTVNETAKFFGAKDDVVSEKFKKSVVYSFANAIPGVDVNEIMDADSKVRPTETLPGGS